MYDRLLTVEDYASESEDGDFKAFINKDSLTINKNAMLEPSLLDAKVGEHFQFERKGYFCVDSKLMESGELAFNQTVALRDSWAKKNKK